MGGSETDPVEARACAWVAWRLWGERRAWEGPAVVLVRARRLVVALKPEDVALSPEDMCQVEAPDHEHFVLRIAPAETPTVRVLSERDSGGAAVHDVVYVPPWLADRVEGS